jgi:hypothetical protein
LVLPVFRYRPIGVRDPRPMRGHAVVPDTQQRSNKEVIGCERSSRDGRACCTPRQCWPPSCSRPAPGTSLTRGLTGARPERKGTRCFERSRTPWARSPFWRWLWAPGSSPAKGHTYHHEAFVAAGPSPGDREGLVAYVDRQGRQPLRLDRTNYVSSGSGLRGVFPRRLMCRAPHLAHTADLATEEVWMRAKVMSWKHWLFTAAVLATLALAAGARYKPK